LTIENRQLFIAGLVSAEAEPERERKVMKAKLTKEVQLLSNISKAFAESLDLEATLKSILKSLDTHLKLQRGTITLLSAADRDDKYQGGSWP